MTFEEAIQFVQGHLTDGMLFVVGSGLSSAEGLPGMPDLATNLKASVSAITSSDRALWERISAALDAGDGLEAALIKFAPTPSLEAWIAETVCKILMPAERTVIREVIQGTRTLRLSKLLAKVLKSSNGLPILTPNYDRLVEVACEVAGFHVDTMVVGSYAGSFDPKKSCMGSCSGIIKRGKATVLDHFPRAIVLKPHGSFDWYRSGETVLHSKLELDGERMIITPGLNKYRAGYMFPFDMHREFANKHIDSCTRMLVVGYGFNDDHLQTHLERRIREGAPTLIVTRDASAKARQLSAEAPNSTTL